MNNLINREELLNRTINNPLHSPYITERDVLDCPPAYPEDRCSECDAWNQYIHYPRT